MQKKIAFQLDPLSKINIATDSSYMLIKEAKKLGFSLYYFTVSDVYLENGVLQVRCCDLELDEKLEFPLITKNKYVKEMVFFDIIFIRQDPPFDMNYVSNSYLLEKIRKEVVFVNDPVEIRNAPEKLLVCEFAHYMPETLIVSDYKILKDINLKTEQIILKPLYGCGGVDIFKFSRYDLMFEKKFIELQNKYNSPLVIQEYLPQIKLGDLRVLLACGKVVGQVLRVPKQDAVAANFHAGGIAVKASLTQKQKEICDFLGPILLERKLYFVGLDFIGDYLTEINVTSPTGIQEVNRLEGKTIEKDIWQELLKIL
jgi:glutathione synthase